MMRTIRHTKPSQLLHIETPLGIINVRVGLSDSKGRAVVSVETIPDNFAGESAVVRRGPSNVRLVQLKTKQGGR